MNDIEPYNLIYFDEYKRRLRDPIWRLKRVLFAGSEQVVNKPAQISLEPSRDSSQDKPFNNLQRTMYTEKEFEVLERALFSYIDEFEMSPTWSKFILHYDIDEVVSWCSYKTRSAMENYLLKGLFSAIYDFRKKAVYGYKVSVSKSKSRVYFSFKTPEPDAGILKYVMKIFIRKIRDTLDAEGSSEPGMVAAIWPLSVVFNQSDYCDDTFSQEPSFSGSQKYFFTDVFGKFSKKL